MSDTDNNISSKMKANIIHKNLVRRIFDYEDDNMPFIGLSCTEKQARLIKRLCGSMSRDALRERGFTEDEARELQDMHSTI